MMYKKIPKAVQISSDMKVFLFIISKPAWICRWGTPFLENGSWAGLHDFILFLKSATDSSSILLQKRYDCKYIKMPELQARTGSYKIVFSLYKIYKIRTK